MKVYLFLINPLSVFLWTIRKNEKDVINLYNTLSPMMQITTGGSMLNFGYWTKNTLEPINAQENLCDYFGKIADLETATNTLDVGSGLSAPAIFWRNKYPNLQLFCLNINYNQLSFSGPEQNLEFINSTSTKLPFSNSTLDRVLALESSQHFKPLEDFIYEAKRVLKSDGFLVLALPVIITTSSIFNLGILKITWYSEHYKLEQIKQLLTSVGFIVESQELIGKNVYEPLANYYLENHARLKKSILKDYPSYVEKILHHSILKMKHSSKKQVIDYVIIKCKKIN